MPDCEVSEREEVNHALQVVTRLFFTLFTFLLFLGFLLLLLFLCRAAANARDLRNMPQREREAELISWIYPKRQSKFIFYCVVKLVCMLQMPSSIQRDYICSRQ